jgi:hypothetical protein
MFIRFLEQERSEGWPGRFCFLWFSRGHALVEQTIKREGTLVWPCVLVGRKGCRIFLEASHLEPSLSPGPIVPKPWEVVLESGGGGQECPRELWPC